MKRSSRHKGRSYPSYSDEECLQPLYKYRSLSSNEELERVGRIFTAHEVYFAAPDTLNDPLDCRPLFIYRARLSDKRKKAIQVIKRECPGVSRSEARKRADERWKAAERNQENVPTWLSKGIGVFSLSETSVSETLWRQYADDDRGICLEFRVTRGEHVDFLGRTLRVIYVDQPPAILFYLDSREVNLRKSVLTKTRAWEHEKEWRIVDLKNGPGLRKFPPDLLSGVIIGAKITSEHKELVLSWVRSHPTPLAVYQADRTCNTPERQIIRIYPESNS